MFDRHVTKICRISSIVCSLLLVVNPTVVHGRGDAVLSVTANRDRIYLGESFILTVRVAGSPDQMEPDLSALTNCTVRLLDSQTQNFQQIVIVNGRMQKTGFVGRIFTYEVTPSSVGPFRAGPIRATVSGRAVSDEGPVVQVDSIEKQEEVLVSVTASRDSVLVTEPFEITLRVALRALPGRYADLQPLDPRSPPQLRVSCLDGEPIKGLEMPDVRGMLQKLLVRSGGAPGFHVNEYTARRDPFDLRSIFDVDSFFGEQKAVFQFPYRFVEKNGKNYVEYTFVLRYVPKQEGTYTFGPVVFKGQIVADVVNGEPLLSRPIFAVGPACHVRVVPPPEEGRPLSYTGAIGTGMNIEATLDTQTCNVGDPLTLTISVSGDISMDNMRAPALAAQEDLLRDFRLRDDTVQITSRDGRREYAYQIRPVRVGTYEVPPIAISYFDLTDRAYKTVYSKPIPLRVHPAPQVDSSTVISAVPREGGVTAGESGVAAEKIVAPIVVVPEGMESVGLLGDERLLVLLAVGPVGFLLTSGIRTLKRRVLVAKGRYRTKLAGRRAIGQLRLVERRVRDPIPATERIYETLRAYVRDRFAVSIAPLTPPEVAEILQRHGVSAALSSRFAALMETLFNAMYSGATRDGSDPVKLCREAVDTVAAIENETGKKSRARRVSDENPH